jgi:HAAS domain-containing protein
MDKLEQYLDQVCRSIGGPRSLRQHIRQELREHLRDAIAEHQAAGMAERDALDRALADFGGPEQVRAELEATHGHRLLPVVIDKALQWKERTMKAKWLWMTWAHLALVLTIALEVWFITFIVMAILPKFQGLVSLGLIYPPDRDLPGLWWMSAFLNGLEKVGDKYTTWLLLLTAAAWALFEWRVRSENKPFIRLSALGTAALALLVVVYLAAASLLFSFCVGVPGRLDRPWVTEQMVSVDNSVSALEQAITKNDWGAMRNDADRASQGLFNLVKPPAVRALTQKNDRRTSDETLTQVTDAANALADAQEAIRLNDPERLKTAMQKFHKAYDPIREAAKRQAPSGQ